MAKLKLGLIADEKPVRLTAELAAAVHRDLLAYPEVFGRETGQAVEAAQLVGPMLARFMATDRAFAKARKSPRNGVNMKTGSLDAPPREDVRSSENA